MVISDALAGLFSSCNSKTQSHTGGTPDTTRSVQDGKTFDLSSSLKFA